MSVAIAAPPSSLVTPEAIASYRRDGAVLIKGFLTGEELSLLETGLEEAHANPSAMFSSYAGAAGMGKTFVDQYPSAGSPALRRLIESGRIAELAARLMGTPSAQLVLEQMFYKESGHVVPTPWHQDTPFLSVRGKEMARVWLSCDPSPADVTVQTVRGSHLWNVVYDTSGASMSDISKGDEGTAFTYDGIGDDRLPPTPDIEAHRESFDIMSWDVEPGDAIVFQGNVLHGASGKPNHPHRRRAFASMWGGPALRYHRAHGHAMPLPSDPGGRALRDGTPIGELTDVFPVYWQES